MNRSITLAGFAGLAAAFVLCELFALRAKSQNWRRRPLTFGESVAAVKRLSQIRWPMLAGWLWLGWHLFARVHRH